MANLTPTPDENADVFQWDGQTPLIGGSPTAPLNRQAQALLNRIAGVKATLTTAIATVASAAQSAQDAVQLFLGYRQLAQIQRFSTGAFASGTTRFNYDNTVPLSNEGDQYLSVTIPPQDANSTLTVKVLLNFGINVSATAAVALYVDDETEARAVTAKTLPNNGDSAGQMLLSFSMVAGSTSPKTFKVRAGILGAPVGTFSINGLPNLGATFGGKMISSIEVKEYLP